MKRNLFILAGILIVLWCVWFLYTTAERAELSVTEQRDFFWVDSLAVDSAAFKYVDWTNLALHGDTWMLIGDGWEFPADQDLFARVMRTTNGMVLENVISTNPAKFRKFEVDTLRGRTMRYFADGRLVADFIIGKAASGYTYTYVRKAGSDTVRMARGDFQNLFTMMPDQWKSRIIFDNDTSAIESVRWIYPDHETRLVRNEDRSWGVWKTGMSKPAPADTAAVREKLASLSPLYTPMFHPDNNPDVPTFDTLGLQLIVETSDGDADTVVFNALPPGGKGRIFARLPGRPAPTFLFYDAPYKKAAGEYDDLVAKPSP